MIKNNNFTKKREPKDVEAKEEVTISYPPPICYWCGIDIFRGKRINGKEAPDMYTKDHIYCKLEPERHSGKPGANRTVPACHSCNQRRNDEFHKLNSPYSSTAERGAYNPKDRGSNPFTDKELMECLEMTNTGRVTLFATCGHSLVDTCVEGISEILDQFEFKIENGKVLHC